MFDFEAISVHYPWIIILLPLPWVVYYSFSPVNIPFTTLYAPALLTLTKKLANNKRIKNHMCPLNKLSFVVLWGLLLLSLSHPCYKQTETVTPFASDALMIAMDISHSMISEDAKLLQNNRSSRLNSAQYFLQKVIHHYSQNKCGLIMFGSAVHLVSPLTYDHATLVKSIKNIRTSMAGERTAIGDTIDFGIDKLATTSDSAKIMLLLTDGENTAGNITPEEAAKKAAEQGVSVFTLGLGVHYQDEASKRARSTLQQIAETTGAVFIDTQQPNALQKLIAAIDIKKTVADKTGHIKITKTSSLIFYPVFFAFLMSIYCLFVHIRRYCR